MDSPDSNGAARRHELEATYGATRYEAFGLGVELCLRVDQVHPELDQLLATSKRSTWAFLTAWNPRSIPTNQALNQAAHQELFVRLSVLKDDLDRPLMVLPGRGVGVDPSWTPEESYLVLGISTEQAESPCGAFNQWARLAGTLGQPAQLIWTHLAP